MSSLLFEKRPDGIALITLNRPEAMNSLSDEIRGGLENALRDCTNDSSVRCVVITGTGKGFCAGADIKGLNSR